MADFMIRFLICNVFISGIIGILLIAKRIFKNNLSSRMQYNLWFLLLGLLTVPFIPFHLIGFPQIFSWLGNLRSSPASGTATAIGEAVGINPAGNTDWMNDFALSVNSETPSIAGYILLGIWIVGIFAMIIFGNQILAPPTHFGEICTFPPEPGSTQTISSMFRGNGNSQKYTCLQHRIFEIPDYCGTFETVYLSADSSDL